MYTVICPKCKQPITVVNGKGFVICCNEVIYVITKHDTEVFFNEINNPSQPNEALKKAATRYKKLTNETHDRETQA